MSEEIRLRPEQLYFLGQLMGARYIDYAYIADMRELGRNYPYIEQGVLTELSREGLIRKRLGGGTVVRADVASLLMPVFSAPWKRVWRSRCPRRSGQRALDFTILTAHAPWSGGRGTF